MLLSPVSFTTSINAQIRNNMQPAVDRTVCFDCAKTTKEKKMKMITTQKIQKKKNGFTLIEVIAVLVLLGILAAIAVPKYIDMADNAKDRAIDAGISELNSRESLTWGNLKLSQAGWVSDAATYAAVDQDLGADYSDAFAVTGGALTFQVVAVTLTRTASTNEGPGRWSR